MTAAVSGDEIWVAAGTYKPDQGGGQTPRDREATFQLINGVELYGGFPTGGDTFANRDPNQYETILSGDIGVPNKPRDNCYHVFYHPSGSALEPNTILDGFRVTGGNANGDYPYNAGGGMFNESSSPTVTGCTFSGNSAFFAGGMHNYDSSPTVTGCTFSGNTAIWGGGMDNYDSSPTVNNCTFTDNRAEYASGMFNWKNSSPAVTNCVFTGNSAGSHGGGMYNEDSSNPIVTDCTFSSNSANILGGGMANNFNSSPKVTNCIFSDNSANDGGGMFNYVSSNPIVTGCTFTDNSADNGGGIYNYDSSPTVTGCTFAGNTATWGGGMDSYDSSPTVTDCTFSGNSAITGGGMHHSWDKSTITGCTFTGNLAELGGGMYNLSSNPTVTDCIITGNWADLAGGGIYNLNGSLSATNCTINGNDHGGLYFLTTSTKPPSGNDYVAIAAGLYHGLALKTDGSIVSWGSANHGQVSPPTGNDYVGISAGGIHSLALKTDGSIVGWGDDSYGQASPPVSNDTYVAISAGPTHSLALTTEGYIVGWGDNSSGQASPPAGNDYDDISAGFFFSLALKKDGSLDGWGSDQYGQASPPAGNDYVAIAAGLYHGIALKADGTLVAWGNNDHGQANPPTGNDYTAIAAGEHNLVLKTDGSIVAWPKLTMALTDCTINSNIPMGVWMEEYSDAKIEGTVEISDNDWIGKKIELIGDGTLYIDPNSTLDLNGSIISCDLSGTGIVKVDLGTELIIEGDALVDMAHANPVTDPDLNGIILCDGLLRVKDNVVLRNTTVVVTRASFEGDADVSNSVIIAEAGSPYGQFFIEDSVTIAGNDIHADGDRYMDLDPSVFGGVIANNRIFVTITEGVGQNRGGLFELRGDPDLAESPCGPEEFFCQLGSVPVFDPNSWMLEQLELWPGAKVNLTNRFDFGNGGYDEVLYVKELILGPGSVLNTAFNQLYYQDLYGDPNCVKNEPLLGFSLSNIACNNDNEFLIRVIHNNFTHPLYPSYNRIHVERVTDQQPDPAGMMRMTTLQDNDPESLTYEDIFNARAKGTFAKSSEETILVLFEYLFETSDPGTELVIYLTDVPELLAHNDPARVEHYLEVARLSPPIPGQVGSAGSGSFGVFQQYVSRGDLDFIRGTRIEFELLGPDGSSMLINNWDPQVHCEGICMDITWDDVVDEIDFLTVIGGSGGTTGLLPDGTSNACLNGPFSDDGFVDSFDVIGWDWTLNSDDRKNLCYGVPLTDGTAAAASILSSFSLSGAMSNLLLSDLLILGKRGTSIASAKLEDRLYSFDTEYVYTDAYVPASQHTNIRLVQDPGDEFYQVNLEDGLVRISDSNSILPPGEITGVIEPRYNESATVHIGIQGQGDGAFGRPVVDVAFDPDFATNAYIYAVPVVVSSDDPNAPVYTAAAKFELLQAGDPPYQLIELYDDIEAGNPDDNRNLNGLREIEVDSYGNVYVANAMHNANKSNLLWRYNASATMTDRIILDNEPNLPAPVAMYMSDSTDMLYLASSLLNSTDADSSVIRGFSTTGTLALARTITINYMHQVTGITEDPATGTLWVVGFTMFDLPDFPNPNDEPFYYPYLAEVPVGSDNVDAVSLSGPGSDLALPLSIVWTGELAAKCGGADITGSNGRVDFNDFAVLASQWLDLPGIPSADIALPLDNFVDNHDLAVIAEHWLQTGCD